MAIGVVIIVVIRDVGAVIVVARGIGRCVVRKREYSDRSRKPSANFGDGFHRCLHGPQAIFTRPPRRVDD
jgi:hypothetical protein